MQGSPAPGHIIFKKNFAPGSVSLPPFVPLPMHGKCRATHNQLTYTNNCNCYDRYPDLYALFGCRLPGPQSLCPESTALLIWGAAHFFTTKKAAARSSSLRLFVFRGPQKNRRSDVVSTPAKQKMTGKKEEEGRR